LLQCQEVLQLTAEISGALGGARVGLREIQRQRRQRVEHPEGPHLLSVDGLHPDDADDHVRRHAELLLGPLQRGPVVLPELHAGADADGIDEAAAIGRPVLGRARGRRLHQAHHHRQQLRLADGAATHCGSRPRLSAISSASCIASSRPA